MLWPDRDAKGARANLRQLLYRLRGSADVIGGGNTLAVRSGVGMDASEDVVKKVLASIRTE